MRYTTNRRINVRTIRNIQEDQGLTLRNGKIVEYKTGWQVGITGVTCKTPEEKRKTELEIFGCDYFLCSSNAVTEDGILVNIDGNSNRVAAIAYGPSHIVMIVGMNKIAKNLEEFIEKSPK